MTIEVVDKTPSLGETHRALGFREAHRVKHDGKSLFGFRIDEQGRVWAAVTGSPYELISGADG